MAYWDMMEIIVNCALGFVVTCAFLALGYFGYVCVMVDYGPGRGPLSAPREPYRSFRRRLADRLEGRNG